MKDEGENNTDIPKKQQTGILFKKIRISREKQEKAAIIFLLGVFFLLAATPVSSLSKKTKVKKGDSEAVENKQEEKSTNDAYIDGLENKLEQIIGSMEGAGQVRVMITLKDNGEKILDKNQPYESESRSDKEEGKESESTSIKSDQNTVLVEEGGNTVPIVIQERYPEIEGVFVICEGGDNQAVAIHIKEAVQALFSIDAHKIVVYKIKK